MDIVRAARLPTDFAAQFADGVVSARCVLHNISRTGAWLTTEAAKPSLGSKAEISVHVGPGHVVRIAGTVTRTASEGFAVEFSALARESVDFLELLDLLG